MTRTRRTRRPKALVHGHIYRVHYDESHSSYCETIGIYDSGSDCIISKYYTFPIDEVSIYNMPRAFFRVHNDFWLPTVERLLGNGVSTDYIMVASQEDPTAYKAYTENRFIRSELSTFKPEYLQVLYHHEYAKLTFSFFEHPHLVPNSI